MLRRLAFLFLAIVISGGGVFLAQKWLQSQLASRDAGGSPDVPSLHSRTEVLVAKGDIPAGSFLRADSLRWQEWPQDGIADNYIVQGKGKAEDFVGAVARSRLSAGEPITISRVVHPGDRSFMAAVLTPGSRAVTVNVTPSTGMAGFVFPGDHVDLVLSMVIQSTEKDAQPRHLSETVLTNLRVLGMDQKISDEKKDVTAPKTATLEVTPKQAEIVAVVSELGLLSLSLRSLATEEDRESSTISRTWDTEATHFSLTSTMTNAQRKIDVIRGSDSSEVKTSASFSREAQTP